METPIVPTDQSRTQIKAPRTVGSILHEIINTSNEPLYKGYRAYLASKEKGGKDYE